MSSIFIQGRTFGFLLMLAMSILLWYFMNRAEGGIIEKARKLVPVEAMEEAISRALEMGKPSMVTYSFQDSFSPPNMVGLDTVRYIAKISAEKGGKLLVAAGAARTLPVARENYRLGCIEGGSPELFDDKNIFFFTKQQWAYASGVMGIMEREKPAACIFIGPFLVEGIHLGINSRRIDTVAIGGNPSYSMGAFMFVAMDYVLFGEEIYAAGAYMSEDPAILSTLATEDIVKWFIAGLTVLGALFAVAGSDFVIKLLGV